MVKKKSKSNPIVIAGLVCISMVEAYALYLGINGTILTLYFGIVAGTIGVSIPTPKFLGGKN